MSHTDNNNLTKSTCPSSTATTTTPKSTKNESRPASLYDNFTYNNTRTNSFEKTPSSTSNRYSFEVTNSPTQAHCLMTTVPQNIAAQNIAHKHTPTRNSLRHSRMIAMNKNGQVPRKYLPAIIRYHKLAKALLVLITLFGLTLCFLTLWLLLWTPNLRTRDNPLLSGISVLGSGVIGFLLLSCFRKEYPGMRLNYLVYSFKILSIFTSSFAAAVSFISCTFATIHLISLYTLTCSPPDQLNTTCICKLEDNDNYNNNTNITTANFPIKSYHYVDLSCPEVENILTILVILSLVTNLLAGILEIWYIYLHWASRYKYTYSRVRTSDNTPIVVTNRF